YLDGSFQLRHPFLEFFLNLCYALANAVLGHYEVFGRIYNNSFQFPQGFASQGMELGYARHLVPLELYSHSHFFEVGRHYVENLTTDAKVPPFEDSVVAL